MKVTLHELVHKLNIPKSWLAEICGFNRTQLSNWVTNPEKYPIPENKKKEVERRIRDIGRILSQIDLK